MQSEQNTPLRQMTHCLVITVGLAWISTGESGGIPFHGVFLKLGLFEWILAVWLPVGAAVYASPSTPKSWWIYYSLLSLVFVFVATHHGIFYTLWGRRPWMSSPYWAIKLVVVVAYVIVAPVVAGIAATHYKATPARNASTGAA